MHTPLLVYLRLRGEYVGSGWRIFTLQFSDDLWLIIAVFLLSWFIIFSLVVKLRPSTAFLADTADRVAFILRGMVGIRSSSAPDHSTAVRIMFFVYIFTCNIIFMVYKANMTSAMAVRTKEQVLTTWEQVLLSDYKVMLPAGSFMKEYLRTSEIAVEREVADKKVMSEEFLLTGNTASMVSDMVGGRLYVIERGYITVDMEYPCSIEILDKIPSITAPLAFAFPQGSRLRLEFDKMILSLYETGVRDRVLRQVLRTDKTSSCSAHGQHSTRLGDIVSAFFLLGAGAIVSIVSIVLEMLLHCYSNK